MPATAAAPARTPASSGAKGDVSTAPTVVSPAVAGRNRLPLLITLGGGVVLLLAVVGLVKMFSSPAPTSKPTTPRADPDEVAETPARPVKSKTQRDMGELIADIKNGDPDTKLQAALILDKADRIDKSAVAPLIVLLQDRMDTTTAMTLRKVAARSLGKIGLEAEPAVPQLRIALGDPIPEVRFLALEALGHIGTPGMNAVIDALREPRLQFKAADILSRMGADARAAVPTLLDVMKHAEGDQRVQVASCILKIDPTTLAVLPDLIAGLKNSNDHVRRTAALSLGAMGKHAKSAEEALYDAATLDLNADVRSAAEEAYHKIGGGK